MNYTHISGLRLSFILILLFSLVTLQACKVGGEPEGPKPEAHVAFFADNPYEGTTTCLECHQDAGDHMLRLVTGIGKVFPPTFPAMRLSFMAKKTW